MSRKAAEANYKPVPNGVDILTDFYQRHPSKPRPDWLPAEDLSTSAIAVLHGTRVTAFAEDPPRVVSPGQTNSLPGTQVI
ncbi:hypothetical protein GJ744_004324 [Endocarpon pusillum]|uniref:Uncharacterized protein n=1 Tax=Endocarpon pusillum TaxID=364733 RepID=A0A8H7A7E4_9EURO|nr:hypothetical protein GJ744_004324 [Endocarpon pusillum]